MRELQGVRVELTKGRPSLQEKGKPLAFQNYLKRETDQIRPAEMASGLLARGPGSQLSHPPLEICRILRNSAISESTPGRCGLSNRN